VDFTPAHRRAVAVAADGLERPVREAAALWTWGPTIVVRVRFDDGQTAYLKASTAQDVHTEAAVIERVRAAGVPVSEVLRVGVDEELPGRRWMITQAAAGETLQDVGRTAPTVARTLDDLAQCYTRLHRIELPGFGPIAPMADHAVFKSWSIWQAHIINRALDSLTCSGAVSEQFVKRARLLSDHFAPFLDAAPATMLHADLGDREIYIDPSTGAVTALIDWGDALIGDPLYDLVRFVGGGPAGDPRPAQLHPGLNRNYFKLNPQNLDHAHRMMTFYRFHICIIEAAWENSWAPAHIAWADRLIDALLPRPS
jgi:aminoglycoside phosphotransferase (APT) family kinase protein